MKRFLGTCFVTGAAGFIGSALIRRLLLDTSVDRVVAYDSLTYASDMRNLDVKSDGFLRRSDSLHFVHGNVCDQDSVAWAIRAYDVATIFHLAAESHVDRSISGPLLFVRSNVEGTACLLEAARSVWGERPSPERFRFHHVSTDEIFGDLEPGELPFWEDSPLAPSSPYSASKAAADHMVRAWGRTFGIPYSISSCSNNYGPRQHAEKLIPTVIRQAMISRPIPVYGDGQQVRDWIYVDDHCDAMIDVASRAEVGSTYLVGARCEIKNIDLIRTVCDAVDKVVGDSGGRFQLVSHVIDRAGHDRRYAINPGRIEQELSWKPKMVFEDGIFETVRWYLGHRDRLVCH